MSLLPRNKIWSKVLLPGLFSQVTCSFANSERRTPGSGGRRAKPLPPCPLKPQLRLCRGRCALQTDLQSRLCGALRKGEGSVNAASRVSILNACSKVCPQTCCRRVPELLSSLITFVSYSKKVTSEILIRIDYFILLFLYSPISPIEPKRIPPEPPFLPRLPLCKTENGNTLL